MYWGYEDVFNLLIAQPGIKFDDADVVRARAVGRGMQPSCA